MKTGIRLGHIQFVSYRRRGPKSSSQVIDRTTPVPHDYFCISGPRLTIIEGTDQDLFRSLDNGQTWPRDTEVIVWNRGGSVDDLRGRLPAGRPAGTVDLQVDLQGQRLQVDLQVDLQEVVLRRARQANIVYTFVSPLSCIRPKRTADVFSGNTEAVGVVKENDNLRQWVVLNPLQPETFGQVASILSLPQCVGIKTGPSAHGYNISEWGEKIFETAAEHKAILLSHSGEENSRPEDFIPLANRFPEVTLILAHLGCTWDDDPTHHVKAIQHCVHDNVYIDTSSMMSMMSGLLEWTVEEIGSRRLLFGTDSPLHSASAQRERINTAEIEKLDKRRILADNAIGLFGNEYAKPAT